MSIFIESDCGEYNMIIDYSSYGKGTLDYLSKIKVILCGGNKEESIEISEGKLLDILKCNLFSKGGK